MDEFKKCVSLLMTLSEEDVKKALQLLEILTGKTVCGPKEEIVPGTFNRTDFKRGDTVFFWDSVKKCVTEGRVYQMSEIDDMYQVLSSASWPSSKWLVAPACDLYKSKSEAEKAYSMALANRKID